MLPVPARSILRLTQHLQVRATSLRTLKDWNEFERWALGVEEWVKNGISMAEKKIDPAKRLASRLTPSD